MFPPSKGIFSAPIWQGDMWCSHPLRSGSNHQEWFNPSQGRRAGAGPPENEGFCDWSWSHLHSMCSHPVPSSPRIHSFLNVHPSAPPRLPALDFLHSNQKVPTPSPFLDQALICAASPERQTALWFHGEPLVGPCLSPNSPSSFLDGDIISFIWPSRHKINCQNVLI